MGKMTQAFVKAAVKDIGRELTVRQTDGEWRVAYAIPAIQMVRECSYNDAKAMNEASAAYTNDADDALAIAKHMHNVYVNNPTAFEMGAR